MRVLLTAHTSDEHGLHIPGEVLDLPDGEAQAYSEKQWGIIMSVEEASKQENLAETQGSIEDESLPGAPETALSQRGKKK